MMRLLPKTNIDFLKYRKVFFTLSGIIFLAGFACLFLRGFNYGIEFTGGTLVQVTFVNDVPTGEVRKALSSKNIDAEIQSFTDGNAFSIKIKGAEYEPNETKVKVQEALNTLNEQYKVDRTEYVGPAVGKDMTKRAVWALLLALSLMIVYIAFRFQNIVWGTSGVLGILHDVMVMLFMFSFLHREIDLVIVAALLTVAGYSINDNIVVFDRMRERMHNHPKEKMYEVINNSLNETLSRTIITTSTVLVAVVILYFMGGEVLKNFSLAMIIGTVCGVYSTIAIATPLVYQWAHSNEEAGGSSIAPVKANSTSGVAAQDTGSSSYREKKKKKHAK